MSALLAGSNPLRLCFLATFYLRARGQRVFPRLATDFNQLALISTNHSHVHRTGADQGDFFLVDEIQPALANGW